MLNRYTNLITNYDYYYCYCYYYYYYYYYYNYYYYHWGVDKAAGFRQHCLHSRCVGYKSVTSECNVPRPRYSQTLYADCSDVLVKHNNILLSPRKSQQKHTRFATNGHDMSILNTNSSCQWLQQSKLSYFYSAIKKQIFQKRQVRARSNTLLQYQYPLVFFIRK